MVRRVSVGLHAGRPNVKRRVGQQQQAMGWGRCLEESVCVCVCVLEGESAGVTLGVLGDAAGL